MYNAKQVTYFKTKSNYVRTFTYFAKYEKLSDFPNQDFLFIE